MLITTTIHSVTRRQNSTSGNPTKVLHTDRGVFVTAPDAACAHYISDGVWNEIATLSTDEDNRVIGLIEHWE
jgi:hypothetical protein